MSGSPQRPQAAENTPPQVSKTTTVYHAVDLWPLFWVIVVVCFFLFSRGCDGEPSFFEMWLERAYPGN